MGKLIQRIKQSIEKKNIEELLTLLKENGDCLIDHEETNLFTLRHEAIDIATENNSPECVIAILDSDNFAVT